MVATIIEEPTEEVELDLLENEELGTFEEEEPVEDKLESETVAEEEPEPEDDLPEKYQNKTRAEIVQMHQEAEKMMGRQSTEVGELRRMVDDYVKPNPTIANPEPVEEIDFFDDPNKAMENAIANNPALKNIQAMEGRMKKAEFETKLSTAFPDFNETINDPEFAEWVKSSSVRIQQYQAADGNADFASADELLSNWAAKKKIVNDAKSNANEDLKTQRKKASSGGSKGTAETKSRKIYKRSDIIDLMINDRPRYDRLSEEIGLAYAEGRVK